MASSEDDVYDYNDASDDGDAYGSDDDDDDDDGCAYDESYESGDVGHLEGIDPNTSELISQEDDDGDCYDSDVVYTDSCDDPDSDHNVVDSDSYDSGVDSHYGSRNIKQQMEKVYLEFDGASKGNPGRSGAGAVLKSEDGTVITRVCEGLGDATNNEAEYRALIRGLKTARDMGYDRIHVKGDSQLVYKQVKGEWQTRNSRMARYCDDARRLSDQFKEFEISHIPRCQNSDADAEANKGLNLPAGEIQEVDNWNYRRRR